MTPRHVHIVGHGLAGALLAETASRAGLRVSAFDDNGASSSRVAAGLYTPLTGRRLIPGWRLHDALPVLQAFYPALEADLGVSFFHPLPTLRLLRDPAQRDEYRAKQDSPFIGPLLDPDTLPLPAPCGAFEMSGSGWVDLPPLLDALRARRQARGEWGTPDTAPDLTVWAQGVRAARDPLWSEVGWRPAHGDILTLRIPGLPADRIINFGRFLLPLGGERFRCGATYNWNTPTPTPRERGRQELEHDLATWLPLPYEILDHRAGLRPVALARVPVVGPHPDHPDQWIFNGFASKGVLYAPWMARALVDHWHTGTPLPRDVLASRRIHRQRARETTRRGQQNA